MSWSFWGILPSIGSIENGQGEDFNSSWALRTAFLGAKSSCDSRTTENNIIISFETIKTRSSRYSYNIRNYSLYFVFAKMLGVCFTIWNFYSSCNTLIPISNTINHFTLWSLWRSIGERTKLCLFRVSQIICFKSVFLAENIFNEWSETFLKQ